MRLLVGLGNPGKKYENTRHNAGFMIIDALAAECGIGLKPSRFNAHIGKGRIEGQSALIAKPAAFMNLSGGPVSEILRYYRLESKALIVIHDDIDLAYGRIKIKEKGGHGGHRGIKSIMEALGGGDFTRLRIGVGRSEAGNNVVSHVLGSFTDTETAALPRILKTAAEAVRMLLCEGIKASMNKFNDKRLVILS
jgi:PTH1 family peptidyl-tRNA hydrolase